MICRLTPVKHGDVAEIAESIIPKSELKPGFDGSYVRIWLEPNEHASKGLAIRCDCHGCKLGYVPELASVIKWKGEHDKWTKAVEAIRNQLFLEYDMNGTESWNGHVAACRYVSHEGGVTHYCLYDEYGKMPPEEQKKWKLEQVAVRFPVEVL